MRENVLLVCLGASALVNVFLLWLNWRALRFAGEMQAQRDNAQSAHLGVLRIANQVIER